MSHHHFHSHDDYSKYSLLAALSAVATVSILIIIKTYAYYMSGSAAVLGTLLDSVVDATISVMILFAVRLSSKPADKEHRYGHGKVEGIVALLQGALMAGAGLSLAVQAIDSFLNPQPLQDHILAISVAGIAIIMSIIIVFVQKYALKRAPSLAIEADHAHYKTDIALNGGVILALFVDYYGGQHWIDSSVALFIAGYFTYTAYKVSTSSFDMLMDKELPDDIRNNIKKIVLSHPETHDMHDLRTRMSGMKMYISLDIELDPAFSLKKAHDIAREVDNKILDAYPNAEIIIHMDPIGETDDHRHKDVH